MSPARQLTLLVAVASALLAVPSASAQEVELHNQTPRLAVAQEVHAASDATCPFVTPSPPPSPAPTFTAGGCRLHIASNGAVVTTAHLSAGGTEAVVSDCAWEFTLRLDVAGEGWINHQELTGPNPPCTRQVCGQPTPPTGEGRAWTFYLQEREVAGVGPREEAVILICTAPLSDPTFVSHCEVTIPLSQVVSLHRYRLTAADVPGHGTAFPHCEYAGSFDSEAVLGTTGEGQLEQNVEVRHT